MNDKISIIVPVYKVEKYLKKCVDSLINQSYKSLEIILVDDGSPDRCPLLCEKYAQKDDRIKVIHKDNGGLSDARNKGIEASSGNYIMFVDSDDYVDRDICRRLLSLLHEHQADFSMCTYKIVKENEQDKEWTGKEKISIFEGENVLNQMVDTTVHLLCIACAKLYKREIFDNIRFPVGKLHEDEFVLHKILLKTSKFVHTTAPMYYYLSRENSITSSITDKNIEYKLEAMRDRFDYLNLYSPNDSRNTNIYMNGLRSIYLSLNKTQKKYKKAILSQFKELYKRCKNPNKKNKLFKSLRPIYSLLYNIKRGINR